MNHKTLPTHYRYAATLDFMRDRRQMLAILKLSAILIMLPLILGLILSFCVSGASVSTCWRFMFARWWRWPVLILALIAYIPLHELTHGIAMYALSGVRPTYGLSLPYAYAGSTEWFDRRSHICTALMPVILWGIVFEALWIMLPGEWFWFFRILQISNLSGSAGDIYCVWALSHMDGDILIQDTGVRMRVFKYRPPTEESKP
ncbi:MAG: DUF3267 domain-containing protein [Clostridia bacterium]|nr:DUF3267 domain-containing protein [Clostridia bacterium]